MKTVIRLWIPQKKANFVPLRFIIRAGARQDIPVLIISVLKMISSKHMSSGYLVNKGFQQYRHMTNMLTKLTIIGIYEG